MSDWSCRQRSDGYFDGCLLHLEKVTFYIVGIEY
jgi:hypothetical protein